MLLPSIQLNFFKISMLLAYHVQSWLSKLDAPSCSYAIWIQQMAYAMGHKWFSHTFVLMYWNVVFSVATMQARLSSSHISQSMLIQLSSLLHFHIANFQSGWLLQWQSISLKASPVTYVGLDLRTPVFSHGQLYVALSHCTSGQRIRVLFPDTEKYTDTLNIVYPEALLPS